MEINEAGQVTWAGNVSVNGNPQIYVFQNGSASLLSYPGTHDSNEPHLNNIGEIVWRATTASGDYFLYFFSNGNMNPVVQVDSYANGYALTDGGDITIPGKRWPRIFL